MSKLASETVVEATSQRGEDESLSIRRTPELVIALVGPVASGVTTTGKILSRLLAEEYNYQVNSYRISEFIKSSAHLVGKTIGDDISAHERVRMLQDAGNTLREKLGGGYLVAKCIEAINLARSRDGVEKGSGGTPDRPKAIRVAHIIDSIKNPAEVEQLQQVYGRMFWLFAVFAPEKVRKQRLTQAGCEKTSQDGIIAHDQNESASYGQKVRDTIELADFFIRNDQENDQALTATISRYLEIIFHSTVHTPTVDECAMYDAQAAASNSACMSRQVGAAIYSQEGQLLSVGWNDVPKFGGGLYKTEDGAKDNRCFRWGGKICHNDFNKNKLKDGMYNALNSNVQSKWRETIKLLTEKISQKESSDKEFWRYVLVELKGAESRGGGIDRNSFDFAAKNSGIDGLIEFSRAVHAEMEAIISAARSGVALRGATLYCTTFPCHSCARHIIAAGISKVIYIEPYPKSRAHDLHSDAIAVDDGALDPVKTMFIQYDGVAPRNILSLFKSGAQRKDRASGEFIQRSKKDLHPLFMPAVEGFATNEMFVIRDLEARERKIKGQ